MDAVFQNSQNNTGVEANRSASYPNRLEALEAPMRSFLYLLFTSTALLALTGNVVVIVVERLGTRSAKNLRKFLTNLAVSDILFGVVCIPFSYTNFMLHYWMFPVWLCPLTQFVQVMSVTVTTFTLTVIGLERSAFGFRWLPLIISLFRYLVILFPLSEKIHWLTDKCNAILIFGWIFGALLALYPTVCRDSRMAFIQSNHSIVLLYSKIK